MNKNALIVGPTGKTLVKWGDVSFRQFSRGDYIVSIEWYQDGRECEPIMAIWSKFAGAGAGVFGICLSSIAKYVTPRGGPTWEGMWECWVALPMLGRNRTEDETKHLMDVILRHTPDLLACPPMSQDQRMADAAEALLEATLRDQDGKTLSEVTL